MIRDFVKSDLNRLKPNGYTQKDFEAVPIDVLAKTLDRNHSFTFENDGEIELIASYSQYAKNCYRIAILVGQDLSISRMKMMKKFMKDTAKDLKAVRLETDSIDDDILNRWHKMLGFSLEGVKRKFNGVDDYNIWAMTWDWNDGGLQRRKTRYEIQALEDALSKQPLAFHGHENDTTPVTHYFNDGVYTRKIFIPATTLLVGMIHKHEHPNFLIEGEVTVITEQGGTERIKAPCMMVSPAGTKRVVYAHKDTVWATVHPNPTDSRDVDKLVEALTMKDYKELDSEMRNLIEGVK